MVYMRLPESSRRRLRPGSWLLLLLAVALILGMGLTLWAGWSGRMRSRHGVSRAAPGRNLPVGKADGVKPVGSPPQAQGLGVAQLGGPVDLRVDPAELVLAGPEV